MVRTSIDLSVPFIDDVSYGLLNKDRLTRSRAESSNTDVVPSSSVSFYAFWVAWLFDPDVWLTFFCPK